MEPRKVVLVWKREQYEDGVCTASDSFTIDNAALSVRNGACYLTYVEGISEEAAHGASAGVDELNDAGHQSGMQNRAQSKIGQAIRTTLRITEHDLTLIRQGTVRWNHTFKPGQKASSTMHVGGSALVIETRTNSLTVHVTDDSGEAFLDYDMNLSGMIQTVKLWIRFGEHDGESTEEAKYN